MSGEAAESVLAVSADAHVNEPHDLWYARLPESLRDKAPRRIQQDDGGNWTLVVNGNPRGWQSVTKERAEQLEAERVALASPDVRLAMMERDGIGGEVIYPTIGLYLWDTDDPAVGKASCRVYNDWITERLRSGADRIKLAALIPTWDMDDAIEELHRTAAKGFAAAMLPLVGTPPWNDVGYERLWDAIAETGLPVVMHQGTGQGASEGGVVYRGPGSAGANILTAQTQAPRTAALLASGGVLARHPDLHVVLVEVNGGWLAWCMEVLDEFARANPVWAKPKLSELPSHYIRRQIHCTFQNDPVAIANLGITGPGNLMWGNDYPHDEGTFPNSQKVLDELFKNVSAGDRQRIIADNSIEIFGFDRTVVSQPVVLSR